jgi:hypothetical protein
VILFPDNLAGGLPAARALTKAAATAHAQPCRLQMSEGYDWMLLFPATVFLTASTVPLSGARRLCRCCRDRESARDRVVVELDAGDVAGELDRSGGRASGAGHRAVVIAEND